jgi:hypothetical protein
MMAAAAGMVFRAMLGFHLKAGFKQSKTGFQMRLPSFA